MAEAIGWFILLVVVVALAIITSTNDDRAVRSKSHGPVDSPPLRPRQFCNRRPTRRRARR